jgi:DNA polymerase/3'-5' exonuclease PolX
MTKGYQRDYARSVAEEMVGRLAPYCQPDRLEIAGSLRRLKPHVGDIELVYISRLGLHKEPGSLFAEEVGIAEVKIQEILKAGIIAKRPNCDSHVTWGPQNKLAVHVATGVPLDLFATTPDCWWNYLVCRTGPADLNERIAREARQRGLHWHPYGKGFTQEDGTWLVMHSEREVFETVGLPYREPKDR